MATIIIRQRVRDYQSWKRAFISNQKLRREAGFLGTRIFRTLEDPECVVAYLETGNLDKAREFFRSHFLAESMAEIGAMDKPNIMFLDEGEAYPY